MISVSRDPTMHDVPQEAKLLAYTSLCRPILEYVNVVWDPSARNKIHDIELVQNIAKRNLKRRTDSASGVKNQIQSDLWELKERTTDCASLI